MTWGPKATLQQIRLEFPGSAPYRQKPRRLPTDTYCTGMKYTAAQPSMRKRSTNHRCFVTPAQMAKHCIGVNHWKTSTFDYDSHTGKPWPVFTPKHRFTSLAKGMRFFVLEKDVKKCVHYPSKPSKPRIMLQRHEYQ